MSKKLKLSPWHDGSVKPVHVGVYEVEWVYGVWDGGKWFNFWDGTRFIEGSDSKSRAKENKRMSQKA